MKKNTAIVLALVVAIGIGIGIEMTVLATDPHHNDPQNVLNPTHIDKNMSEWAFPTEASKFTASVLSEEEKTRFIVILAETGPNKIRVIKVIKEITLLGLKEAKALADNAPSTIKENISEEAANDIKSKLEAVGAKVELK